MSNRCIHFKGRNESVNSIEKIKKILDVEIMFTYRLGVLMHKFNRDTLPVNFKPYFNRVNKKQNHQQDFQRQIIISLA